MVLKAYNTHYAATDDISPNNNLLETLLSDVKLEFNQKQISDSLSMYHYRAYLEDFFILTTQQRIHTKPLHSGSKTKLASMMMTRMREGGKIKDLAGKVHCDLFITSKFIINEIDIRFLFVKNKLEVCLMKVPNADPPCVSIVDATLWIRKFRINPGILIAHIKSFNVHTAKYPFKSDEMHNYTIPMGSKHHTVENMFLGKIPCLVIIGTVSHSAFSGSFSKNPYNFQHFNETIKLTMDCVSMEDWQNGNCLYPIDLTPELSANEQHWCIQQQGNIRLEIGTKTTLGEAVMLIVYAEFREVLEIEKNRNISIEMARGL
ncbi:hypothetical protein B566_EDAN013687 [Ephemera danica]|nr:hypothetical protein B566_EDAN013687 [Ephemera danica]